MLAALAVTALALAAPQDQRPNVLLITMDQLAHDWIGALGPGFPAVDTPNIDRLVAAGVSFDRHYSDNEVCHPSRCSILTGKPPLCHLALDNDYVLSESETTMAEILAADGWRTAAFGKIHPRDSGSWQGFDVAVGADELGALLRSRGIVLPDHVVWLDPVHATGVLTLERENQPQALLTEMALQFAGEAAAAGAPWFVYLGYFESHPPSTPTLEAWQGVAPADVPAPLPDRAEWVGKPHEAIQRALFGGFRSLTAQQSQLHYMAYAAMVEQVDREVGRLLDWVEQNPDGRDTLILFTADHGDMAGQLGVFEKLFGPYDNAVRVPAIVALPGALPGGLRVDALTQHSDLLPTVLELAGLPPRTDVTGVSLVPMALGGPPPHEYVFSGREAGSLSRLIFDGRYALIDRQNDLNELYDLLTDPEQAVNRYADPALAGHRVRLHVALALWRGSACQ